MGLRHIPPTSLPDTVPQNLREKCKRKASQLSMESPFLHQRLWCPQSPKLRAPFRHSPRAHKGTPGSTTCRCAREDLLQGRIMAPLRKTQDQGSLCHKKGYTRGQGERGRQEGRGRGEHGKEVRWFRSRHWRRVKRGHCPSCQRRTRRVFWPVRFGHVPSWVGGSLLSIHPLPLPAYAQSLPHPVPPVTLHCYYPHSCPLFHVLPASSPLSLGPQPSLLPSILRPWVTPGRHVPSLHAGFSPP